MAEMPLAAGELPTNDPRVLIETRRKDYIRYRDHVGNRWEVRGACIKLGHCLVGAVLRSPQGDLVQVRDLQHLEQLKVAWGTQRIDSELDVPVRKGFETEGCCVLEIVEL